MTFAQQFQALSGHPPFPWQRAIFDRFVAGPIPEICSLPTGMGKTSIIAVWLIALAEHPDHVPRRLAYVVNRRTVVDQTTVEVEKYRENLKAAGLEPQLQNLCAIPRSKEDSPLAISTLRGQFADNREWSIDPARPAVICGTVDMIGSRLLFSGYGCGFKTKPLHAGFLGQDTLLVHDEAHLEPAFQVLIETIRKEQESGERTGGLPWKKLQVMELTATPRGKGQILELGPDDRKNAVVRERIAAKKSITLIPLKDAKKPGTELADKAISLRDTGKSVIVFARTVEDVTTIAEKLDKLKLPVERLTGTLRGNEREGLIEKPVFARFQPESNRPQGGQQAEGTVYLVCTSAGEVGVNISADHMVCDLSTFDSMAQRFGRVNRFGKCEDSSITVLHPIATAFDPKSDLDRQREKTLTLLLRLNGDASPDGLSKLDPNERTDAFAPTPTILPATDILFDSWALTTVREKLPGRPPVEQYLHGLSNWEPAQTKVAWREEVEIIQGDLLKEHGPEDLLDIFPLKPAELLSDRTDRVFDQLKKLLNGVQDSDNPVWVISDDGTVTPTTIQKIIGGDKKALEGVTLLLPPSIGGLQGGMLDPSSESADDVSCELFVDKEKTRRLRFRFFSDAPAATTDATAENVTNQIKGMRLVLRVDTQPDIEEDTEDDPSGFAAEDDSPVSITNHKKRYWFWFERVDSGDELGGRTSKQKITWDHHTSDVTANAQRIADKLLKNHPDLHSALVTAAKWHDLGKKRVVWQRSIGRPTSEKDWYAKSAPDWSSETVKTLYRHEFGSLVDILSHEIPESRGELQTLRNEFISLSLHVQDLVLHLIATHHGHARPHFPADRAFDPEPKGYDTTQLASDIPRRFARLQRQYGRWGLAYLESLLRAADGAASAHPTNGENTAEEARR